MNGVFKMDTLQIIGGRKLAHIKSKVVMKLIHAKSVIVVKLTQPD